MKRAKLLFIILLILSASTLRAQKSCWTMSPQSGGINLTLDETTLPYWDHIEMSGEKISFVLRWGVDGQRAFSQERSLVFPMLRTIPNNTHASLMYRLKVDIISLLGVNGLTLQAQNVNKVEINGALEAVSQFGIGVANVGAARKSVPTPVVEITQRVFPTTKLPMMCETYEVKNISQRQITLFVPKFLGITETDSAKGVDGIYIIHSEIYGSGTYIMNPGETVDFSAAFQAYRKNGEQPITPNVKEEYAKRISFINNDIDGALVLETPEPVIDRAFRFAKIRATESIFDTKGGYMHGPGGESYYAAIWANDQAEYVNPFYPFLGYEVGNKSSFTCYKLFSAFQNDEYKPIPSSIIAEGLDTWGGAGDRGDAAMMIHGGGRYLLARGNKDEAKELWPFMKWCIEYCHRQLNEAGVPKSDSDELEGRFPTGDANLSTASLYYDGLISAIYLSRLMDEPSSLTATYKKRAQALEKSIENYFGGNVGGFETYKYYEGNTLLRSWICLPLCFGINNRAEGTLAALYSPKLLTEDGLLTQEGNDTFWDRSTLYALRGAYAAGSPDEATKQLLSYSKRRLLGEHVPYPIEAYPEGSQRHLSAESGLYCRIITEGLFGIRPAGFEKFNLTVQLPAHWNEMALRKVKAFNSEFDIEVRRISASKAKITIKDSKGVKNYTTRIGQEVKGIAVR